MMLLWMVGVLASCAMVTAIDLHGSIVPEKGVSVTQIVLDGVISRTTTVFPSSSFTLYVLLLLLFDVCV